MSKYDEIFDYLRQCPQLNTLWSIYAEQVSGTNVILPMGTSSRRTMTDEKIDTIDCYSAEIRPALSVYEEYQINCYRDVAQNNNDLNAMSLEDVQAVCDWIIEQDENENLPDITGKQVISIEPFPFNPQIRGIDPEKGTICYFITVRITYRNTAKPRSVEL